MDPDADDSNPRSSSRFRFRLTLLPLMAGAVGTIAYASQGNSGFATLSISTGWLIVFAFIGLGCSAFFTFLDHAVFSLNPDEIENLERGLEERRQRLTRLHEDLDRTWFSLLAGSLFSNLLCGVSLGLLILEKFQAVTLLSVLVALVGAVVGVLVLGEVLPGLIASRWRKTQAYAAARYTVLLGYLLAPLWLLPLICLRFFSKLIGLNTEDRKRAVETEKRLLALIGLGKVDVNLEDDEREMIDHALEFSESTALDIMTPRGKIAAFDTALSQEEAIQYIKEARVSRVIVYDRSLDNVVGIIHTKQILLNTDKDYHHFIDPPLLVLETMNLFELMSLMKKHRRQIAVVLDEYSSTAGIVTMNNLLEAIVGPSSDENDEAVLVPGRKGAAS
ncbi:MAG: CNNM domain-containing protein [Candidatus Sumerlaeota bacterium]